MVITPKTRGFICTTAHPEGCRKSVENAISYVEKNPPAHPGPKKVLVIGSSQGYGLASRISAAFGYKAATLGVFLEKPSVKGRCATAGWYNSAAFEQFAHQRGLYCKSINGDAFSDEIKQKTIETIREDLGKVDCVIYSLASPRRIHPRTGQVFQSVLKPIGQSVTSKSLNTASQTLTEVTLDPASQSEIDATVAVMGGEDWKMWIEALDEANVLAPEFKTVAYSYIGPSFTHAIYRAGTIGAAKEDLEKTAAEIDEKYTQMGGGAWVSVNRGLVTQASSAIPIIPLYLTLLSKQLQAAGLNEDCTQQMHRMMCERLYAENGTVIVDDKRLIRMDDWEMRSDIQDKVADAWEQVNDENLAQLADLESYKTDFLKLFGFEIDGVRYEADTEVDIQINQLIS